jgi:serine/threonine-protein kinase
MGEVYRARDTRLERIVAIKVLPAGAAGDPQRRERFEREARAISSLNHTHICTLYDVGHHDGTDYLVMELLDGQTLGDRLRKGALPIDQALTVAIHIADALDAAHRRGIIHRDLKPANIFLARSGTSGPPIAKLLDFGIAKVTVEASVSAAVATLTSEGAVVGTLHYMAPEQLEGRDADARSDLFAFGAVLYETFTGRRAFPGESQASVIAAVLETTPPSIRSIDVSVPPALEHLLSTCLAKDPEERWQSARDVKRQLEWIATSVRSTAIPPSAAQSRAARVRRNTEAAAIVFAALIVTAALTWSARAQRHVAAAPPRVSRMTLATSGSAAFSPNESRSLAITPDGTRIVYVGNNATQLFVRPLDELDPTAIATAGAPLNFVFLSPDGQWVGFAEGNMLRKVAITGGPVTTIQPSVECCGAAWAPDDTIIVGSALPAVGLRRTAVSGGTMTELTHPNVARGETGHIWPEMLPGGHEVLFTIASSGGPDAVQIALLDLPSGAIKVVVPSGSHAHYVSSDVGSTNSHRGHLVYAERGALRAIPFDLAKAETIGTAVTVQRRLVRNTFGGAEFVVAADGTFAYAEAQDYVATAQAIATMVWVDRQGREQPLSAPPRPYVHPRLSPDGTRVAVAIADGDRDIWVWDIRRQSLSKLSFGSGNKFFPMWTADGRRVFFARPGALVWQPVDGSRAAEPLSPELGSGAFPSGATPDGAHLLFSAGGRDQMMLALDSTRRVQPLVHTASTERNGVVSPDGRWLAYESNSSGRFEIYVRPFPDVEAQQWLVSAAGGTRPLWAPNGKELFYIRPDGAVMTVPVHASAKIWSASSPSKIVEASYLTVSGISGRTYDVSPDGKGFLMLKRANLADAAPPAIIVVQHWFQELNRLAPPTPH